MRKLLLAACVGLVAAACTHALEIDQRPPPVPAAPVHSRMLTIGVVGHVGPEAKGYVDAIAHSLETQGIVRRVVYPFAPGAEVDVVADVSVTPEYRGSGLNFLVNFPGFLVWAPAWNGYRYYANPRTRVDLARADGRPLGSVSFDHQYRFHQADMGRTWTEISWLEVGVIALVSGIVFTRYDTDQTLPFIDAVSASYGEVVATMIANELATATP
jgi:hypothetical protein